MIFRYFDVILKLSIHLSTHIMEGKLKVMVTYPKSEEIMIFIPYFCAFADFDTRDSLSRTAMV